MSGYDYLGRYVASNIKAVEPEEAMQVLTAYVGQRHAQYAFAEPAVYTLVDAPKCIPRAK